MKTKIISLLLFLFVLGSQVSAQQSTSYNERYGHTLNLGLGIGGYAGYYGYVGQSVPVFHINYEFDVARSFTLAPFVTFFTYHRDYYHETVIPLGVKGTYYFDQILGANPNWDFYLAGSLGFSLVNTRWDDGYTQTNTYQSANPVFFDLHIGTEYHLSNRVGIFLDLSTGVSTLGLAFH
jgi:hypothetical protein